MRYFYTKLYLIFILLISLSFASKKDKIDVGVSLGLGLGFLKVDVSTPGFHSYITSGLGFYFLVPELYNIGAGFGPKLKLPHNMALLFLFNGFIFGNTKAVLNVATYSVGFSLGFEKTFKNNIYISTKIPVLGFLLQGSGDGSSLSAESLAFYYPAGILYDYLFTVGYKF